MNQHEISPHTVDRTPSEEPGAQAISFVVRIWREPSPAGSEFRGWIEHVQSGERVFFLGLDRLSSVIAEHIGTDAGRGSWLRQQLIRWRSRISGWFVRGEEE